MDAAELTDISQQEPAVLRAQETGLRGDLCGCHCFPTPAGVAQDRLYACSLQQDHDACVTRGNSHTCEAFSIYGIFFIETQERSILHFTSMLAMFYVDEDICQEHQTGSASAQLADGCSSLTPVSGLSLKLQLSSVLMEKKSR